MRRSAVVLVAVMGASLPAAATDFAFRAEPSAAVALSEPQATYFTPGPALLLSGNVGLLSWLEAQLQLGGVVFPARSGAPVVGAGAGFLTGVGLRALRPRANALVVPWVDASFDYLLTGGLSRLALAGGAGVMFCVTADGSFCFGPEVRYLHMFKLVEQSGYLSVDAQVLTLGLSLEFSQATRAPVPEPADVDTDGDTVMDKVDKCPREPGLPRLDGCPDPDPDHDGVLGSADKCPNEPEDFDGFEDQDGCPDPDNDKDGVPDTTDACPNQPGTPANQGCPDTDGDGVNDRVDQCINVPGPKDNGGCPHYKQVVVTEQKIEIKQKIFFAYDKSEILPKSFELMDEVTQALKDHDRLCVRIEGHTDAKGNRPYNLKLSDDRARSVMQYLLNKTIVPGRLSAVGYGPDQPLDDNRTAEGREKNRRVEFVIVQCAAAEKAP